MRETSEVLLIKLKKAGKIATKSTLLAVSGMTEAHWRMCIGAGKLLYFGGGYWWVNPARQEAVRRFNYSEEL